VRHRVPADVLLLVTVLCWSFNFTVVKYALTHGWEPLAYSSVRFAVGAVLFSAFTYAREHTLRVARVDLRLMIAAAALGIWLNQLTFAYSVRLTTAATVALMFGTFPIFVALIAVAFGLERPHARHWLATVVSCGWGHGFRAARDRAGRRGPRGLGRGAGLDLVPHRD
jgi:drug/metabolite transporter (DMT)-like permease